MRWVVPAACFLLACGESRSKVRQLGGQLQMFPADVDFGDVALGMDSTKQVQLQNLGIVSMTVTELAALNDPAFLVTGLPVSLNAGETASVSVRYRPPVLGTNDRTLQMATDSPDSGLATLPLHGHAVQGLVALSGDTFDFGAVVVNETATQNLLLVNNDGHAITSVNFAAVTGDGSAAFKFARQGTLTLASDQSTQVMIQFTPTQIGEFVATVAVTPCPTCSPQPLTLKGVGAVSLIGVNPAALDFGQVLLGQSVSKQLTLTNLSQAPLALNSLVSSSNEVALALNVNPAPLTLAPGESIAATVTWSPRTLGPLLAQGTFNVSDGAPGTVAVTGTGIGPVLQATPRSLFVGATAIGTTRSGNIVVTNVGLDPGAANPLVLSGVKIASTDGAWSLQSGPASVGEPGQSVTLKIAFTPSVAGTSTATLSIDSNDGLNPHLVVPLSALARQLLPCTLNVSPQAPVDYGSTPVAQTSIQGFELTNTTADDCIIGDPILDAGSGGAFVWPGNVVPTGRTLPPAGRMSIRVGFLPQAAKTYSGSVTFYVSNHNAQSMTVPLTGTGDPGCFFLTPATADFGANTAGCAIPQQTVFAVNHCSAPVTVTQVSTTGSPFSAAATVPFTVQQQTALSITVSYNPASPGDDVGAVWVTTSLGTEPRAGLTGGSQASTTVFDQWTQTTPKVDLLIVVDNSSSMVEEQRALQQSLDTLWNRISLADADFHIAVTTTGMTPYTQGISQCPGGADGGEAGRFFPVDNSQPRILTPQTPNVKQALSANTAVGTCHWDERFLDPVVAALTPPLVDSTKAPGTPQANDGNAGFLRDDARLSLLAVSDSDDDADVTNPPAVSEYVQKLSDIKHGALDLVSFAGIVPLSMCNTVEQVGTRYQEIAKELHGNTYDICQLGNFSSMLDSALTNLLAPVSSFPLSAHPADPAAIQVTVNSSPSTSWSYDAVSNRIVFPANAIPAPGAQITATYQPACS
jgi:Abnormal spindle-like microcephaly-assoc'd, ASPM-SPD-2-Hydin